MTKPNRSAYLAKPLQTWTTFLLPLVTFFLASADSLLMVLPHREASHWKLALLTTVPLSAAACALTAWIQFRLRTEIERRTSTESRLRTALDERGQAIEELSRALERERLLLRELDHRVRNNLASILGLLGLYERSSLEPAEVVRSLRGRISSLCEVHGLIGAGSHDGVDLARLVETIAAVTRRPCDNSVVRVAGPLVRLRSREATAFAMIFHELLTNAAKHGALRAAIGSGGSIEVAWTAQAFGAKTRLHVRWEEHGGAAGEMSRSKRKGSGLDLVEGIVRSDLRGRVSFGSSKGYWVVDIVAVLETSAAAPTPSLLKETCSS